MADSVSLGGITIKFGADLSQLKRAGKEAQAEIKGFNDALGRIALKGAIKGDPFSATKEYMKTARTALDATFSSWANSLEDFDHKMGATANAARREVGKLVEQFNRIPDEAKQAVAKANAAMKQLTSKKQGLLSKPIERKIPEDKRKKGGPEYETLDPRFLAQKAKSKKWQDQFLKEYSQFGKKVGDFSKEIVERINKGKIADKHALDAAFKGLEELMIKHKNRLEKKTQAAAAPELFDKISKAYDKLGKLEQKAKLEEARSQTATKNDRVAQQDKLLVKEARLLTQRRQGMDTTKQLLKIYEKIVALNRPLTASQQQMVDAEKERLETEKQIAKIRDRTTRERKRERAATRAANAEARAAHKRRSEIQAGGRVITDEKDVMLMIRQTRALAKQTSEEERLRAAKEARIKVTRRQRAATQAANKEAEKAHKRRSEILAGGRVLTDEKDVMLMIKQTREKAKQAKVEEELATAIDRRRAATRRARKEAIKADAEAEKAHKRRSEILAGGRVLTDEKDVKLMLKQTRLEHLRNKELERQANIEKRIAAIQEKRAAVARELKYVGKTAPAEVASEQERMLGVKLAREEAALERKKRDYAKSATAIRDKQIQTAKKYRREISQLNAEIRNGFNVQSNQELLYQKLNRLKETGAKMSKRETLALNKLTVARRKATIAQEKANKQSKAASLIDVSRLAWFAKLRAYWAIYQVATDSVKSLVEAHTQLSRALRTARSEFKSATQVATMYHDAMKQAVEVHGVGWEQAGEVLYQLGSAGLSAEESLAALHSTMSLIVGTEGDARETTKAIAGIYNNYADNIKEASTELEKFEYINDLVAKAWSEHQVEISELTDGYKQSIAMTKAAGLELNELTAILSVANDHMIKGGRAGRALQNVFMRLSRSPYEFAEAFDLSNLDFDPAKPIKFIDLMGTLSDKMQGGALSAYELSRNFERLGLRGGPIFTTLLQNWNKVEKALKDFDDVRGESTRLEEVRLDNLAGAWSKFTGTLKSMVQELSPIVIKLKEGLISLTKAMNNIRGHFLVEDIIAGDVEANQSHLKLLEDYQKTLINRQRRHLEFRRQLYADVAKTFEFRGQRLKAQKGLPLEQMLDDLYKRYPKKFKGILESIDRAVAEEYKRIDEEGGAFRGHYVVDVVKTDHMPELQKVADLIAKVKGDMTAVESTSIFTDWEAPLKKQHRHWDELSDEISDAQKAVTRFMVVNNMGEFDNVLRKTFSEFKDDVNTFDWGKVDGGLGDTVDAMRDVKNEFKELKAYGDESQPAFSEDLVKGVNASKQMLYFRKAIADVDDQVANKKHILAQTAALALQSKTRGEDYEREQRFETARAHMVKAITDLESERAELVAVLVSLTEKEKNAIEDQLRSYKARQALIMRESDTKIRNLKYLGLTTKEEYKALGFAKDKLSAALERNRAEYAIGRLTKEGEPGALRELEAKKTAADLASKEVHNADELNIHKERTNSIMKEYAAQATIIATKFKKIETIQKLNTQTQKEALDFTMDRSYEIERNYKLQMWDLEIQLAKVEGTEEEAAVKAKIAALQSKITDEAIKQVVAMDGLRRNGSIVYDMFTRLRDITKDITTWWHDLVFNFIEGFAEGMTDIFYDFISGSQEAQQEVINLESELEDLEYQAAVIEEKGIFSYEEAQNLVKLQEEIAAVKDEINELQDPLKQAENAFKDFFKELIDEIGKMIIKMLVLKAIQTALGWGSGSTYVDPLVAGTGPGYYDVSSTNARGGITPRIKSMKAFGSGGITGNPMMALLGDNPSGKELIIPAENISKDKVSGYARESNEQPINVVNILTRQDIAAALSGKEGERVVVNHIGRDLNNNGPIARRLRI